MQSTCETRTFNSIEDSATDAAIARARTGRSVVLPPDPAVYLSESEHQGIAAVLRHRLRLGQHPVVIGSWNDTAHSLFPGGTHFPAVMVRLSHDGWMLPFLATYNDRRRLVFDVMAPCPRCRSHVPTEEISGAEDLGDFLLQARDVLGGSPRFRYSPAHRAHCSALGD